MKGRSRRGWAPRAIGDQAAQCDDRTSPSSTSITSKSLLSATHGQAPHDSAASSATGQPALRRTTRTNDIYSTSRGRRRMRSKYSARGFALDNASAPRRWVRRPDEVRTQIAVTKDGRTLITVASSTSKANPSRRAATRNLKQYFDELHKQDNHPSCSARHNRDRRQALVEITAWERGRLAALSEKGTNQGVWKAQP